MYEGHMGKYNRAIPVDIFTFMLQRSSDYKKISSYEMIKPFVINPLN